MTKNMEEVKVGSKVELNSGGPLMTVKSLTKETEGNPLSLKSSEEVGGINCQWFEGAQLKYGTFPLESLSIVGDNPTNLTD